MKYMYICRCNNGPWSLVFSREIRQQRATVNVTLTRRYVTQDGAPPTSNNKLCSSDRKPCCFFSMCRRLRVNVISPLNRITIRNEPNHLEQSTHDCFHSFCIMTEEDTIDAIGARTDKASSTPSDKILQQSSGTPSSTSPTPP